MDIKEIDIEDVISKLTLDEKAALLSGRDFWHTSPIHRLGVPSLRLSDSTYGVRGTRFSDPEPTASIPSGSVLASSWNVELMYKLGGMMGDQARAKGAHLILGPTINMARSPLGGRSFECFGEDPVLTGLLSSEFSRGIQDAKVMICPKHLVCNDKEDFRTSMNVNVSERALREIYLLPFMMLQKFNNPESYMTAYNRINGVHGAENKYIMQDIVKREWGFDGCFISDWTGVGSCAESINAGCHLEMPGPAFWRGKFVTDCVERFLISEASLNEAVRGVLTLVNHAAKSGVPEDAEEGGLVTPETIALNRQAAREALVLLKNEGVLPLAKKKVLVIGDSAKRANYAAGGASTVNPYNAISLYDALVANLGEENVDYALGAPNRRKLPTLATFAKEKSKSPIKLAFFDESRSVKDRKAFQETSVANIDIMLFEFDPTKVRKGHHMFANFSVTINVPESRSYRFNLKNGGLAQLLINGEVVAEHDSDFVAGIDMGISAPQIFKEVHLEAGKDYLVEVEFESTSGKSGMAAGTLACGVEVAVVPEDHIKEAAKLAKDYEQVIVITGLNKDFETEGLDRDTMDLPPYQDLLVESLLDSNPNTVVVIESGTPTTLPWESKAKAILHSGYLGEELGNAIFDVLFGDYNPSGKLTFTWPKRYEDNSAATSFDLDKDRSLTYLDDIYMGYRHHDINKIEPLFAFGYGLSYTSFEYGNLKVQVGDESIELTVDVKNTGDRSGAAVVQAYVSHKNSSVPVAVKGLKGFTKVEVEKGATVTAKISINKKLACSFYDISISKWSLEKGDYQVSVGPSSDNLGLTETFTVKESETWIML